MNLPFEMQFKSMEFGAKNHREYPREHVQQLETWLNSLGLRIGFSEVFRKQPGYNVTDTIHADGRTLDNHVKINWIVNPGASTMSWYKIKPNCNHNETVTNIGTPYLSAKQEDCDLIIRENLITAPNRPALVNAGQLHGVENLNTDRYCYSFMLQYKNSFKKVPWDSAVEIFKDYF